MQRVFLFLRNSLKFLLLFFLLSSPSMLIPCLSVYINAVVDLGGGCRGCIAPPPPPPFFFLYNWCSAKYGDKCVFSTVHIMLLPSQKPSSCSLLKFVYISQLRNSLAVYPLKKKAGLSLRFQVAG